MPDLEPCPCGGPSSYSECCQPCHSGVRRAETAEALMRRSRYAAFVRGDVAYLVRSLHPSQRHLDTAATIRQTLETTRWTGLRVLATAAGQPIDAVGEVEFVAFFEDQGTPGELHERSRFRREADGWLYVDAAPSRQHAPPAGRAACWCGSQRRYRRCHGRH